MKSIGCAKNVKKGRHLYTLRMAFELATFDQGLAALDEKMKGKGETITKLPSSKEAGPGELAFDIIIGTVFSGRRGP